MRVNVRAPSLQRHFNEHGIKSISFVIYKSQERDALRIQDRLQIRTSLPHRYRLRRRLVAELFDPASCMNHQTGSLTSIQLLARRPWAPL